MALNPTDVLSRQRDRTAAPAMDTERRFHAGMALFFFLTALAGFVPSSIGKIAAIQAGQRSAFPLTLHAHAVIMGGWMTLLLVQSMLVARRHVDLHRRLGLIAFLWVPLVVIVMAVTTRTAWVSIASLPPGAIPPELLAETRALLTNIMLGQLMTFILFPLFIGWAIAVRRTDPDTHKRLMLFGTLLPLLAGVDRVTGLFGLTTIPRSGDSLILCLFLWISPALIFDYVSHRRVHRAYLWALAITAPFLLAMHLLWGTAAWESVAASIVHGMGVTNW